MHFPEGLEDTPFTYKNYRNVFCFMASHKTVRFFCIFDKKANALIIDIGSDFYIEQLLEFDFARFL